MTHRILKKMNDDPTLSDDDRKNGGRRGKGILNQGMDAEGHVSETAIGGIDTAAGAVDYAGGGKNRNWSMVNNENAKDAWGDKSLQSEGIPIASAALKSINLLIKACTYIKDMVDFAKANKKEDGKTTTTKTEKLEVAQKTVDLFLSGVDAANSILGTFQTFLGRLPIVGAIVGTITSCFNLAGNIISLIRASRSVHTLSKRKDTLRTKLATRFDSRKNVNVALKTDIKDEGASRRMNKEIKRKERLDEFLIRDKGAATHTLTDEERAQMEDYDVASELSSANKKRMKYGIIDIICKDATGIATSLATLDPTGLGASIGASISAVVAAAYGGRSLFNKARQKLRNRNMFGTDVNKSEENKAQRRHNLAVIIFDRMAAIRKHHYVNGIAADTTDEGNLKKVREAIPKYQTMEENISALGVGGPLLRVAGNSSEASMRMVRVIREGFYRDNTQN